MTFKKQHAIPNKDLTAVGDAVRAWPAGRVTTQRIAETVEALVRQGFDPHDLRPVLIELTGWRVRAMNEAIARGCLAAGVEYKAPPIRFKGRFRSSY